VIYEHGRSWWNDIERGTPDLSLAILPHNYLVAKQGNGEGN
jgi:hypothetical protein